MKKFKEIFIHEIERSDIDSELPFYDNQADDYTDFEYMNRGVPSESPPMKIEEAITVLRTLEKMGANYVYMSDHCDHKGYEFCGVLIKEVKTEQV